MFVLVASTHVKPNANDAFAQAFEQTLLPSLRAQPGFKDEMLFLVPGGPDAVAVTFWESRETAEAFQRGAWTDVLNGLSGVIDCPTVRAFQLAHSTLHEPGLARFPIQSPITTEPTGVGA